jgi:hypothetical protein
MIWPLSQKCRTEDKFYGLETVDSTKLIVQKPVLANQLLCYVVQRRKKNFERSNFGISKNVIVSCPLLLL